MSTILLADCFWDWYSCSKQFTSSNVKETSCTKQFYLCNNLVASPGEATQSTNQDESPTKPTATDPIPIKPSPAEATMSTTPKYENVLIIYVG